MDKRKIIKKTAEYAKEELNNDFSGHDWWHTHRVWQSAKYIAKHEKADMFIVELASLLHDIADWKFNNGDESAGPVKAGNWLKRLGVDHNTINRICEIVKNISFKGAAVSSKIYSIEGKIVQDADRLDAMGAMGIARTFAFGGFDKREIYNPKIKPILHKSFQQYKNNKSSSINHFYEKLLLLKDLMNTKTAEKIAQSRHEFMLKFLDEFFKEWKSYE